MSSRPLNFWNKSSFKESWLNYDGFNAFVKENLEKLDKYKRNRETNRIDFRIRDNEKNKSAAETEFENKQSSDQCEFVDSTNSMITSGSFVIETRINHENITYNDAETRVNKKLENSMIKIEVTPDLPCNLQANCNLKSNISQDTNNIELLESNLNKVYSCTHCEKEYKTKRSIVRHFKLKDCAGKSEPNKNSEEIVKAKKRGPRIVRLADNRYQCRHCDKTYTQKNNLFRHMREDHVKLSKPTSCDVCGKEFYNFRKLGQHLRCHSDKPYECSVCCKRFSQAAHVHSHMFTHTGERPYQCNICEKRFSKSFNLKIHIIRHKGEKQFKCRICQTEFFTHGELEKHIRIHTAERPYSCDVCGKSFKQNGHLKKHLLSHTGQKPYKCTMCQKDYVNSSHLKRHLLTHTGEKLPEYLCPICGNNFSQPSTVKRHLAKVHRKVSLV